MIMGDTEQPASQQPPADDDQSAQQDPQATDDQDNDDNGGIKPDAMGHG